MKKFDTGYAKHKGLLIPKHQKRALLKAEHKQKAKENRERKHEQRKRE